MNDHVFVSHAHPDADFVLSLAENLKERGIIVWVDQWNIPPGAKWDEAIDQAIRTCSAFLVVLSPASVASDQVTGEWMLAVDLGKRIVPLLCSPRGEAQREIPRQLRLYQYIDWGAADPGDETLLGRLVSALKGETILPPPSERKRFLERIKELPDDARAFDQDLSKTQAIDLTRRLTDAQFMGLHNLALYRQSGSRGLVRSWALDEIGGPDHQARVILNTLEAFGFLGLSSDPRERNDPDLGYDYTPLFWGYTNLMWLSEGRAAQ